LQTKGKLTGRVLQESFRDGNSAAVTKPWEPWSTITYANLSMSNIFNSGWGMPAPGWRRRTTGVLGALKRVRQDLDMAIFQYLQPQLLEKILGGVTIDAALEQYLNNCPAIRIKSVSALPQP
jgi:hypothetical protein